MARSPAAAMAVMDQFTLLRAGRERLAQMEIHIAVAQEVLAALAVRLVQPY